MGRPADARLAPRAALVPLRIARPDALDPGLAPTHATATAATPGDTAAQAQHALPALIDVQAGRGAAARSARDVADHARQQCERVLAAGDSALAARRAARSEAAARRVAAQADVAGAQAALVEVTEAHGEASRQRQATLQALARARQDEAAGPPGDLSADERAVASGRLAQARAIAENAVRQVDQRIAGLDARRNEARDSLDGARARLAAREAEETSARDAVDRLDTALTRARDARTRCLPTLERHADDHRALLDQTGQARVRQAAMADVALIAAHRSDIEQEVARLAAEVADLRTREDDAEASLRPGGDLHLRQAQAAAAHANARAALQGAQSDARRLQGDIARLDQGLAAARSGAGLLSLAARGFSAQAREARRDALAGVADLSSQRDTARAALGPALGRVAAATRDVASAAARLAEADAAMSARRKEADGFHAALHAATDRLAAVEAQELAPLRAIPSSQPAAVEALAAAARGAREAATASHERADASRAPAREAEEEIRAALAQVVEELAPSRPAAGRGVEAPPRRAGSGLRAAIAGRATPLRVDANLGPFSVTRTASGPTTFPRRPAPPAAQPAAAMRPGRLATIDEHVRTAAATAAGELLGGPARRTSTVLPDATAPFSSAAAFSEQVAAMFSPAGEAHAAARPEHGELVSLAPLVLANRLLDHPNPDPDRLHEGHPLRHAQALLVASALAAVTDDPAVAAQVHHRLWNERPALDGVEDEASRGPSPFAGLSVTEPRHAATPDAEIAGLAQATRRILARTGDGMAALLALQGRKLPEASHPDHPRAREAVEHYQLSLRAESALLHTLGLAGTTTSEDLQAAIADQAPSSGLLEAGRLGRGRAAGEHPATLASQALAYATANMARAPRSAEARGEFKPAYVALRNGFTTSGEGSDFNAMTKRLHKFVKYIDVAATRPQGLENPLGRLGRWARRVGGKDMSPLVSLLEAGPLGSDLGQLPAEYRKQTGATLATAAAQLEDHLRAHAGSMSGEDFTRGRVRLAALQLWNERLGAAEDPQAPLQLAREDVEQRARGLGQALGIIRELDVAAAGREFEAHLSVPVQPALLSSWFKGGPRDRLVPAGGEEMKKLHASIEMLTGQGPFVSELAETQRQFKAGDAPARRQLLRQLLISVVAGGDVAAYSEGRRVGIGGRAGFSPGGIAVGDHVLGFTPVVDLSYDHTKRTVLSAGVASNSGVLYLGKEGRHTASAGIGVRAGLTVGAGDVSAGAMGRLGGMAGTSTGVMIRTDKQGREHETLQADPDRPFKSDNWKRMSERVVHAVFDLAEPANRPADGHEMWSALVGKLGDHRDISFGYNRGRSSVVNGSLQADVMAGAHLGPREGTVLIGGRASAAIEGQWRNRSRFTESTGAIRAVQGTSGDRRDVSLSGDVGFTHPVIHTGDGGSLLLLSRSKVGVGSELILKASNGLVRLTTREGRVDPALSFKHREVSVEADFLALVESQRGEWASRLGQRGADGRLRGGDAVLDQFRDRVAALPPGRNRSYIERKNLRPEAAETVNACLAQLDLLQQGLRDRGEQGLQPAPAMERQVTALQERIASELSDEASWQPFRLFVNEANEKAWSRGTTLEDSFTPRSRADALLRPDSAAEAVRYGGARWTLGDAVSAARAGRDLLTLDALPEKAPGAPA